MKNLAVSRPLVIYSCHRVQATLDLDYIFRRKPVDIYSLGDDTYHEQVFGSSTEPFYGRYSDSVSAPNGSGCRVQVGAASSGALPTGAATVLAAGTGYPAGGPTGSLVGCTISAFFLPAGGLAPGQIPATGRLTTNGSRAVASATIDHGGTGYANTGAVEVDVVPSCDPRFWLLKFDHQKADPGWRELYARRAAREFRVFSQPDDHEFISNLTFASADLTSRNSGGAPWWENQGGADAMLAFWRVGVQGFEAIRQAYYDNPAPSANTGGDIPDGLASATGVSADDFEVYYHAQDYGPNMEPGGSKLRVIHLNTLSYTSAYDATDDGTGTSGKTKLGHTQVQWLLTQLRDAKARGMVAVVLSPKDLGNIDNGDSWRGTGGGALGYNGELNYILAQIEADDLPIAAWIGGDRHMPHVAQFDANNGNAGTLLSICPCPYGADPGGLTAYPENVWTCRDLDAAVFGTVSLTNDAVRVEIIDAHSDKVLYSADVPFGERRPRTVRAEQQQLYKPRANLVPTYVYTGTWALRPTSGLPIRSRAYFTDVGQYGSDWLWDGTYWVPMAPVVLYRQAGTLANPLATLTGVTGGTFLTPGNVPAGMFVRPGMRLEALSNFARSTAVATADVASALGGQTINGGSMAATANLHARRAANLWCRTSASQLSENWAVLQNNSTASMSDKTLNFASNVSYTLALTNANVGDSFTLLSHSLTLYP